MANVGGAGEGKMDESKTEMVEGDSRPVHARVLRWGDTQAVKDLMEVLETGHFDLVLGSDLIYPEQVGQGGTQAVFLFLGPPFQSLTVLFRHRLLRRVFFFVVSINVFGSVGFITKTKHVLTLLFFQVTFFCLLRFIVLHFFKC